MNRGKTERRRDGAGEDTWALNILSHSKTQPFLWGVPGQIFYGLVLRDTLHTASPLLAPSGLDSIGVVNSPWAPEILFLKKLLPLSLSSSSLPPQVPFQSHCWLYWPQICQDFPFLIRSFRLSWTPRLCWPSQARCLEAAILQPHLCGGLEMGKQISAVCDPVLRGSLTFSSRIQMMAERWSSLVLQITEI